MRRLGILAVSWLVVTISAHLDYRVEDGRVTEVLCRGTWVRVDIWTWDMDPLPAFYPGALRFTCAQCGEEISQRIAA